MATSVAVDEASRLEEIGFPEFTTKLVTDVFDALVSANIRQTESYIELLQKVGKSLTEFVNETKDDIGGDEILQFLATVVPPENPEENGEATALKVGSKLKGDQVSDLKDALTKEGLTDNASVVPAADDDIDEGAYEAVLEAAAKRLAANKYDLLKEMVKQGILRLVVENGVIETRLTFRTYGSSYYQSRKSKYNRKNFSFRAKAKTGGALSPWIKASASTSYNSVSVSTANKTNQDRSGSSVNIFGGVKINFRTDYLPLNQ